MDGPISSNVFPRVLYSLSSLSIKNTINFANIRSTASIPKFVMDMVLGALKKTKEKKPKQKRVDTLIALDMLSKAYENHYDIAILISGDEDHLPVVDAVKNTGKRVYGVFFESHASSTLKESFDRSLVIDRSWIIKSGLKGKAAIIDLVIPDRIKREEGTNIQVKFQESLPKGYAELMIIGEKSQIYDHTYCFLAYRAVESKDGLYF